ncbi:hypothetical protein Tco_0481897 [Tanacetum coccineum]
MLLTMKDEARSNLNDEENDFMLDNSFGDETLEELTVAVIMMAQIQPADDNAMKVPRDDAKAVSEENTSNKMITNMFHEHKNHGKRKTIINTSADDQIDSSIIFDDPYVANNGGSNDHDSNAHDPYHDELETCKEWINTFESKTIQCSKYKETCDELEREIRADKDTIERILKEKDKIQTKKAFKEQEDRYLEDIVDLEEKLSSHDRIVYKLGQSVQTIHMLEKTPNKVYDPFLKVGLGYKNPERLKKAIAAQPKMYHGEKLYSTTLKTDSPDSEETLEDAEESRLKMRNKMVQLDYNKLNSLYETFVPQQETSVDQTYFSIPFTSNITSESKEVKAEPQISKMPKESKWLNMFDKMTLAINALRDRIDVTLLEDRKRRWMSDSQNSLREFYKTDVIPMYVSLSKTLKELKLEFMEEKNELLENEIVKISDESKDIQANLLKRIKIPENDFKRSQAQSIDFELKVQHQKEKMAYDVSWKSSLSKLSDENMSLKTQVDSIVPERENIKLEYQNLFNSIKAT